MAKIYPTQYLDNGVIKNQNDLRATTRQDLGALIWERQTRPDVGHNIAKIATDAAPPA